MYYKINSIKRSGSGYGAITTEELNSLIGKPAKDTIIYNVYQNQNEHIGTLITGRLAYDYGYAYFFGYYENGLSFYRYNNTSWTKVS